MRKLPSSRPSGEWADLIAFLAVLATGILLATLGHMTAEGVAATCAPLVGLYAAYKHFHTLRGNPQSLDESESNLPVGSDDNDDSALPPSS